MIKTMHIQAESIPQAHYRAAKAVLENGAVKRTQYDRKNDDGSFVDPPGRDASVLITVSNPFNQPRYPAMSYCEIGPYIAEILGVKDHLVIPQDILTKMVHGEEVSDEWKTKWPYTYHQRMFAYPLANGKTLNQVDVALERLAQDPISRRAVVTTRVPEIDSFLKEDIACLGEIHFRCTEDEKKKLYLHMETLWRSRDLIKAWADNVIGLTFLHARLAEDLERKADREVKIGNYVDFSTSLHIYGQDMKLAENYVSKGEGNIVGRAQDSKDTAESLIIPQLEGLLTESNIENWKFGNDQIKQIGGLIGDIKEGRVLA